TDSSKPLSQQSL
ncbi:hypothetical protein D039_0825B, partial [Vibrio parahaemolyticus EKP-028]